MEYGLWAHIPPETAFALGSQHEERLHNQHEIDMPNVNANAKGTTFHHTCWGSCWVVLGLRLDGSGWVDWGFLNTDMFELVT